MRSIGTKLHCSELYCYWTWHSRVTLILVDHSDNVIHDDVINIVMNSLVNCTPLFKHLVKWTLLSNIRCNQTSHLSGSGPKGSKGMYTVLVYDDARPLPYLDETRSRPYTIVNVWKSIRLLLSSKNQLLKGEH